MDIFARIWILAFLWFYRSTTLPKLYYNVSKKSNISVKDFRRFERLAEKYVKLQLDIKYFDDCLKLGLFPKYLRIKTPKLNVYKNTKNLEKETLKKQIT